jgi:hypothetical protein
MFVAERGMDESTLAMSTKVQHLMQNNLSPGHRHVARALTDGIARRFMLRLHREQLADAHRRGHSTRARAHARRRPFVPANSYVEPRLRIANPRPTTNTRAAVTYGANRVHRAAIARSLPGGRCW